MKTRYAFFIGMITVMSMVLSPVADAEMTMDGPYFYTSNRGDNGGVIMTGYIIILEALVSPPGPGTTVTAQQTSGGSNSVTLIYYPSPAYTDDYAYITGFDAGLTGQWQITAVNGGESVTKLSTTLDDIRLLPLAQNLSVSTGTGAMTPTLSWTGFDPALYPGFSGTPVNGSDHFALRVRPRRASDGRVAWDSAGNIPTSMTSYTFPANALAQGQDYLLEVMLNHYEYESGAWSNENRSETFIAYSTPIVSILGDFAPFDYDVDGKDLAVLITNTSLMELETFAQNFGRSESQ